MHYHVFPSKKRGTKLYPGHYDSTVEKEETPSPERGTDVERHQSTAVWSLGISTMGGCSFFMCLYLSQLLWCERVLLITSKNLTFYKREQRSLDSLQRSARRILCSPPIHPCLCVDTCWTGGLASTRTPLFFRCLFPSFPCSIFIDTSCFQIFSCLPILHLRVIINHNRGKRGLP